jgi:four helix bundle protein
VPGFHGMSTIHHHEDLVAWQLRENARFVRIALGSLGETLNHLHDAFTEKYLDEKEYQDLRALAQAALKTATS